jgi:hypothetical protein
MEAGFNSRRVVIRCIEETSQERMKRSASEEDIRIDIPGIIVLYSFPRILCAQKKRKPSFTKAPHNPDSQFSPRSCIFVLSQTADHLESIPIFKQHLETGSKMKLVFTSAFFELIREAASSQLASEEVEYVLDLGLGFAPRLLAIVL